MSLWLDLLGAEIRRIPTRTFGHTRIAEAGAKDAPPLFLLHGIGGHLEAYAKNVVPLSKDFHVIAYDYPGHGLSDKPLLDYTPATFVQHLGEVMDSLGIEKAHLSGESLGGWTVGQFAVNHPERVDRLMLNTAAGLPIVTDKGRAELEGLKALSAKNADHAPTYQSVEARMQWLFSPKNHHMIEPEMIETRLAHYSRPDTRPAMQRVLEIIGMHDDYLIPVEKIRAETLYLWTIDNPVHDIETARRAAAKQSNAEVYVMKGDAGHWPQWEQAEEFNDVCRRFFQTGKAA